MRLKRIYFTGLFCLLNFTCFSQDKVDTNKDSLMSAFILPILLAVIGYVSKSIYEILIEREKRRRNLIEDKLKSFYWPILTRIEQNSSIWKLILHKRSEMNELEKKIGVYVEENIILKNHREIMSVILGNRFLAKFDTDLSESLNKFFRHVAIYEGILQAKENIFPGYIGAPYPTEFDEIITKRTIELQKKLDKKSWI